MEKGAFFLLFDARKTSRYSALVTPDVYQEDTMHFTPSPYAETESRSLDPMTTRGMVSSPHYLATQAGVDILRKGGTALDAAIAVAAVLAVVYPQMCSIGGDNFWLAHEAATGALHGINASGRSGEKASLGYFAQKGLAAIPLRGPLAACTVPGVVSGWDAAHALSRLWGSQLSLADLLQEAIDLAAEGFAVTPSLAFWLHEDCKKDNTGYRELQRLPGFARTFLPTGSPARAGERMRLPDLAATLSLIAQEGPRSFYEGDLAQRMTSWLQANGGLLTARDFAEHQAETVEPLRVRYRGLEACNLPPNTQGVASLSILNILEHMDVASLGEGSADHIHAVVEATKLAFAERDAHVTDPDFAEIPVEYMLSPAHGRDLAGRIDMSRALAPNAPLEPKGDTCWFGVVDAVGNAVSAIQSIFHDFGAGIVAGDTGVLLQNRGSFFSLDAGHINALAPLKRTMHTLNPPMLRKDGKPWLVYGTMGGEGQPQTQAAIVTRMVDFGLSPHDAVAAPRWLYGRSWGLPANNLRIEGRFAPQVAASLRQRGHDVQLTAGYSDLMGHAGAILRDQGTGVLYGATDPRSDGQAAGY